MKMLSTLVFGAGALLFATFATAAPAAAGNAGFGVSIQVGHYDDDGYGYSERRCWNRWYRRHHPYECNRGLRHRARYGWGDRRHWRHRDRDGYWGWHRRHYRHCRDRRDFHDHDRY